MVTLWYRNSIFVENGYWKKNTHKSFQKNENLREYGKQFSLWVYPLSYVDVFLKQCIVLDETIVHNWDNLLRECLFSFFWAAAGAARDINCRLITIGSVKTSFWAQFTLGAEEFLYLRLTSKYHAEDSSAMETRNWTLIFASWNILERMQCKEMLKDHFCHIMLKE